jgi:hypothetical protein
MEKVRLDLDYDILLQADFTKHESSCIKHQIHELTDIHEQYGGFPSTYSYANTLIHQVWFDKNDIDYAYIGSQLGIEVITVSAIKQPPGCVIPLHRDTFFQIRKKHPDDPRKMMRANIFLKDSEIGHIIQYRSGDTYETVSEWYAGDGFMWNEEILHLGANVGMTPKYTAQISGFIL